MKTYSSDFDRHAAVWRSSQRSGGSGGNSVETSRLADGGMAVRDSRNPDGPILFFTPAEWTAFIEGAKDGEFDN